MTEGKPMPTYEYECTACGHRFEAFQSIKDGALRKCRECGRLKLRRVIGAGAGIIFKGSGFYETDYKRSETAGPSGKGAEKSDKDGKKAAADKPKSEDKPSPSKPESKSKSD